MIDDLLSLRALRLRGLYRPEVVRSLIDADRKGQADHAHFVWNLLWREVWFRTYTDRPLTVAHPMYPVRVPAAPTLRRDAPLETGQGASEEVWRWP